MGIGKIYVPKNNICVKIICLLQYDVNDSIFFFIIGVRNLIFTISLGLII